MKFQLLPLRVLVVLLLLVHHALRRPHGQHLGGGRVPVHLLQLLPELVQVDLARGRDLPRQPRPQKLPRLPLCCSPQLLVSLQTHLWCKFKFFCTQLGLVVHKLGREALPVVDAEAQLAGRRWLLLAPKGSVCSPRLRSCNGANLGIVVGCHQCSPMRFEGSCVQLDVKVATGAC